MFCDLMFFRKLLLTDITNFNLDTFFFYLSYLSYRTLLRYRLIYLRQASKKNTFGLFSSCFVFAADNMSFIRTNPPSGHAKDV